MLMQNDIRAALSSKKTLIQEKIEADLWFIFTESHGTNTVKEAEGNSGISVDIYA